MDAIDRTILNLLSLLLGGGGIFAVLTDYNVPELRKSYWGENPFAVKAETIKGVMTWLFVALALVVLIVQVAAEVAGDALPERRYTVHTYTFVAILGAVLSGLFVLFLEWSGRSIAKRRWLPAVISRQRERFKTTQFVLENDGWRADQVATKDSIPDPQLYQSLNLKRAEEDIAEIEKLLELDGPVGDIRARAARMARHFA